MIRIVVADDHAVVRSGLEQLVGTFDDIELVGMGANGSEATDICVATRPDVALLDLEMPVADGIEATQRIRDVSPATNVVIFTSFSDRVRILRALDAGAIGYLLKDAEPDEIHRGHPGGRTRRGPARAEGCGGAPRRSNHRDLLGRADGTRARGPPARGERSREQADRAATGDLGEDGEGSPHPGLPDDRGHGPDAGGSVGGAARRERSARCLTRSPAGRATEVPLRPRSRFVSFGRVTDRGVRRPSPRRALAVLSIVMLLAAPVQPPPETSRSCAAGRAPGRATGGSVSCRMRACFGCGSPFVEAAPGNGGTSSWITTAPASSPATGSPVRTGSGWFGSVSRTTSVRTRSASAPTTSSPARPAAVEPPSRCRRSHDQGLIAPQTSPLTPSRERPDRTGPRRKGTGCEGEGVRSERRSWLLRP